MIDLSLRKGVTAISRELVLGVMLLSLIGATECYAEKLISVPDGLIRHEVNAPSKLMGKHLNDPQALVAGRYRDPQQMYRTWCGQCHETGVGPALLGRSLDANYISYIVRHGLAGMPAFRLTEYSDSDLRQLAQWVMEQPKPIETLGGVH